MVQSPRQDGTDGISGTAVKSATGRTWEEWFAALDERGAAGEEHKAIVGLVRELGGVSSWWEQMVTVAYERARGLRAKHERPEGFQVGITRTLGESAERLFRRFSEAPERAEWLGVNDIEWTTVRPSHTLRGRWGGGPSRLQVSFTGRGAGRTRVVIQHSRLPDAAAADAMKELWRTALARLSVEARTPLRSVPEALS